MPFNTYVDESVRKSFILCLAQVNSNETSEVRKQLRTLRHHKRNFIHMQEESKATQLRISREIVQLSISTTIIVASLEQVSNSTARASALSCAVTQPAFSDSQLVTFDLSNSVARDRQIIREASRLNGGQFPHYRHMNSRHEPLLWLPDIVAWCYGRGGPWRDAVEPLVDEVIEI